MTLQSAVGRFCLILLAPLTLLVAQTTTDGPPLTPRERMMLDELNDLKARVAKLETQLSTQIQPPATAPAPSSFAAAPASNLAPTAEANSAKDIAKSPFAFSDGTTLNLDFDGYYGYNFDHPAGRVNLLRANDVLSNSFSVNQAGVIVERAPDTSTGRRLGYRLDLMFGQNTETLQGSPFNEPRNSVYRNIYQAYGSYVWPVGSGIQLDFGKFASSLGAEGNYTKDQLNYSRSYYFNYLPFYHSGVRATYNFNDKLTLQYWLVNGANQTEDFNGFKSQAAILIAKPRINITWNLNYFEGQEQRDVALASSSETLPSLPTQSGLSVTPVAALHDGRQHIVDSYATFNFGPRWSTTLEGDYVINRFASHSAPGLVYGGAGYLHRQVTDAFAINTRFAYLKDRNGLFSGTGQNLKDITVTGVLQVVNGFQTRLEFRRDFTNQPFFLNNAGAQTEKAQSTATLGLLWWFGGKDGVW